MQRSLLGGLLRLRSRIRDLVVAFQKLSDRIVISRLSRFEGVSSGLSDLIISGINTVH